MTKNSIIAILGALVVLMVIALFVTEIRRQRDEKKKVGESSEVSNEVDTNTNKNSNATTNTDEEKKPSVTTSESGSLTTTNVVSDQGIDEELLIGFNNARLGRSRRHGKERRRVSERAVANLPKTNLTRVFENTFIVTGGCEWSQLLRKNESTFVFDAVLTNKSEIAAAEILP